MICLRCARRRLKNPLASPCEPCVVDSTRDKRREALASLVAANEAEYQRNKPARIIA